jgi:hypothetical protein
VHGAGPAAAVATTTAAMRPARSASLSSLPRFRALPIPDQLRRGCLGCGRRVAAIRPRPFTIGCKTKTRRFQGVY